MKKIIMIVVPLLLLVGAGAGYKLVLAKPAKAEPKPKVHGSIYMLGKEFLVNLEEDRYAKLTVGLVLAHDDVSTVPAGGHEAPKPPEGFGPMGQEGVVRDVITDELTGTKAEELVEGKDREHLKEEILKNLKKHTDVKVIHVLFTDVTVQ